LLIIYKINTVYLTSFVISGEGKMRLIDSMELSAVEARLKFVINAIVARYRNAGAVLTWRLLHQIEAEALEEIKAAPDLDSAYVQMMQSSLLFQYPRTEEPVNFGNATALPIAFQMIRDAYRHMH
jgi:hypothetical protein